MMFLISEGIQHASAPPLSRRELFHAALDGYELSCQLWAVITKNEAISGSWGFLHGSIGSRLPLCFDSPALSVPVPLEVVFCVP